MEDPMHGYWLQFPIEGEEMTKSAMEQHVLEPQRRTVPTQGS